jgi:hypothetical protein
MQKEEAEIHFEPFQESHFELVHYWFNQPHVQAFFSLKFWTREEISKKLTSYLSGASGIKAFITKKSLWDISRAIP